MYRMREKTKAVCYIM